MIFLDSITIHVSSGKGGAGLVSFKRARNKPKLGPDGGDGGYGGDVVLVGNHQLNTLSQFRYQRLYAAQDGERGGTSGKKGANGDDLELQVPLGTIAIDHETGKILAEITEPDQRIILAQGGKLGMGNRRYMSSTHQAPQESTSGGPRIEIELRFELKLLADVGLVGFPNAGKSTLLSTISAARPKVADYPFTTLVPHLGVVDVGDKATFMQESFVMADIPGLIEGASEGKGLGLDFLRHIERTKVLAYLLDVSDPDNRAPWDAYQTLKDELRAYSPTVAEKPSVAVFTKMDTIDEATQLDELMIPFQDAGIEVLCISAVTNDGLIELKRRLAQLVKDHPADQSYLRGVHATSDMPQVPAGFFSPPPRIPGVLELS